MFLSLTACSIHVRKESRPQHCCSHLVLLITCEFPSNSTAPTRGKKWQYTTSYSAALEVLRLAHVVALVEIFGYVSANLIALANGWALGVNAAYFTIGNQAKHEEDSFFWVTLKRWLQWVQACHATVSWAVVALLLHVFWIFWFIPHITVWGSCFFAWIPLLLFRFPPLPPLPPPKSHLPHQITPHSSQLHFSSQLITAPLLISSSQLSSSQLNSSQHPITAPLLTIHSSQLNSSQLLPLLTIKTHHSSTSHHQLITAQLLTIHSSQLNSSQLHFSHLTSHTSLITSSPLTSLITSPLITAPLLRGQQTAFLVAGAAPHNSFKAPHTSSTHMFESCGCLSGGRRSTQSVLEELRRAWPAVGPRLLFAWQAQYTERPGGAAARVAAAGAAAAFRVAGAVHRASWMPFAWQAQHRERPGGAVARVAAAGAAAAFRVAGAVHYRASRTTCGAPPLGCFRMAGAVHRARLAGAVHRASWRSCCLRVASAVHRASWTTCGARGRRWAAAGWRVAGAPHRASWRSSGLALTEALRETYGVITRVIT